MTTAHDWAAYGSQGGRKRARRLSRKARQKIARAAIAARWSRTPNKERSEAARQAALARWTNAKAAMRRSSR